MSTTGVRVADLDINSGVSQAERQRLRRWNTTRQKYPQTRSVPELVSVQAELGRDRVALCACNETLTYGDLETRSNQVAGFLRSLGVDRNALVGVCVPRSAALAVAALGVLKAGAAYVPLDPAYPSERIDWMLEDARPTVLLTRRRIGEQLARGSWKTIHLDADWKQISSQAPETASCVAGLKELAYVIYTSGSTGRPKGVQVRHDSLLNLVFWHQRTFEVGARDRATQLASPGFDAAVWELWPYLTAGASVYLPADAIRNDPEALRDFIVNQGITISFAPTPLAERMINLPWPAETSLRVLLTGADTLHTYPPANLPFKLVNNYGPTECTVVATSGAVGSKGSHEGCPSIGRPISNVQIYLLDERQHEVAIGSVGEIYIGGAGVAQGYLNSPELSAAKFIVNPFKGESTELLYRTGDLARYLPNGEISFLGRVDEQIKIRGFRIEPSEIIRVLADHPTIQASYVMAREQGPDEKQLVAYIVLKPGQHPMDKELREFLGRQLPQHMVPDVFVRIDALPLNGSGKIDRAALPEPGELSRAVDDYIAPRTPVEKQVTEIVAPLLGIEMVSVEENFFLLGGHSLLGTQLIARIRQVFGVELSLRSLFECSTVATLSGEIERLLYLRLQAMSDEEAEQFLRSEAHNGAGGHAIGG
jgi:amino acid adenylation domain-containing protein